MVSKSDTTCVLSLTIPYIFQCFTKVILTAKSHEWGSWDSLVRLRVRPMYVKCGSFRFGKQAQALLYLGRGLKMLGPSLYSWLTMFRSRKGKCILLQNSNIHFERISFIIHATWKSWCCFWFIGHKALSYHMACTCLNSEKDHSSVHAIKVHYYGLSFTFLFIFYLSFPPQKN